MKNKSLFVAAVLFSAIALLFTSCTQKPFTMNENQKAVYDGFIANIKKLSDVSDVPASGVKLALNTSNIQAKVLLFKIVDISPESDVKKGTSKEELEKRFVPKKL